MMLFTTIVPKKRNDGRPVTKRELNEIRVSLFEQFGGLSEEGEVNGYWVDPRNGKTYQDRCIRMTIGCPRERLEEAKQAVLAIGRRLGQRAMWFEVKYYDGVQILPLEGEE